MSEPLQVYNAATTFVDEPLARGWGPRVAFYADDRQVTYAEFAELTNRVGNALRDLGVEMEHRVLLLLFDSPEFACCFFGTIKIGAVAVPVSTLMSPDEYRPTLVFTVPTMYARMLQVAGVGRYDLSSVRLYASSGEPLPAAIFHRWKGRFGAQILDVVGSTENLHDFLANRPGMLRPGSSGVPVPGYECRIVDGDGRDLENGQIGHLLVRGGSTAPHYWNKREATHQTMLGGWLRTGDMFSRDAEGFYWYCGRDDDMLKVGGQWVSPHEVENGLLEHGSVLEAAVAAAPDEHGLLKPKAYVVLKDGQRPSPALASELQGCVKERLAPHKVPRWIEFVDELPKTATGKIQRFRLRASARGPLGR